MKNFNLRLLFLAAIAFCTIGYTAYALQNYWQFQQLDQIIPLETVNWDIYSKEDDVHLLRATYSYSVDNETYRGDYVFKKPVFINLLGAEHALGEFSNNHQNAWISSQNPGHSALERSYPLKDLVSSGVLWIIFIYFLLLPKYCHYKYG